MTLSMATTLTLFEHESKTFAWTERDCAIDMKYKRLDEADRRMGVSQADFYQMHAYAYRYSCKRVILLYPQMAGMAQPLKACFQLEQNEGTIDAATVNLCIDMGRKSDRQRLIEELRTMFTGVKS